MYTYLIGEDEHFHLRRHKSRTIAEEDLASQLLLYKICYDVNNAEYGVITDREFYKKFNESYHNSDIVRRLGTQLRKRVEEAKSLRQ